MILAPTAQAALTLHGLFSDHGVLQRGVQVPVWGTADAGTIVNVAFAGQSQSTTADSNGEWMLKLSPLSTNATGRTLTVTSAGQTEIRTDILVGEVWLTSGQSNMARVLDGVDTFNLPLSIPAVNAPSPTPSLRVLLMNVGGTSTEPSKNLNANEKWRLSDRNGVKYFSAVSFYFGRTLTQALDTPVGIISASAGGTLISRWMPGSGENYNYAISPLLPYAIKGVIWYQGEADIYPQFANVYDQNLARLIDGWRSEWAIAAGIPKRAFPFYLVQLPNWNADNLSNKQQGLIKVREHQLRVSLNTERTSMAVTIDVGEAGDVHPKRKQPVGERLARIAQALDYGQNIVYSGPLYQSISVSGNTATLSFNHVGNGLRSSDGQALKYFEIASSDNVYHDAQAVISDDTVQVSSNIVTSPVKVRYAWLSNPENPNFTNVDGLMATPFRTDSDFWGNVGDNCSVKTTLAHNRWYMISLPCYPGQRNTVADIFGDDDLGVYGDDWIMWTYDPAIHQYVEIGVTGHLKQGVGYWIIQINGSDRILDMPAYSVPTKVTQSESCLSEGCFEITLATKPRAVQWSLIGYPFSEVTSFGDIQVVASASSNCIEGCDLNEAKSETITHNEGWTYNGDNYTLINTSNQLNPWTGYWAVTLEDADDKGPVKQLLPKP